MSKQNIAENYLWFDIKDTENIKTERDLLNEFQKYIAKIDVAVNKIKIIYKCFLGIYKFFS